MLASRNAHRIQPTCQPRIRHIVTKINPTLPEGWRNERFKSAHPPPVRQPCKVFLGCREADEEGIRKARQGTASIYVFAQGVNAEAIGGLVLTLACIYKKLPVQGYVVFLWPETIVCREMPRAASRHNRSGAKLKTKKNFCHVRSSAPCHSNPGGHGIMVGVGYFTTPLGASIQGVFMIPGQVSFIEFSRRRCRV